MSDYKKIDSCVVCKSRSLHPFLDLTEQPLANSYHRGSKIPKFPLGVQYCSSCHHNMLTVSVNPELMFKDYLYVSDTSKTLTKYFEDLAVTICERVGEVKGKSMLEIACNSGLFLEMFKEAGMDCFGVDPAANLRPLSSGRGLDVDVAFWDLAYAKELASKRQFDVICAVHVLPHVPNPVEFLEGCKLALKPGGKIYIQTSQCDMFKNKEFDAIYHEHVSYFTAHSFKKAAEINGLVVTGAWKAPIHSMSFVFEVSNQGEHGQEIKDLIQEEQKAKRNQLSSYFDFAHSAQDIRQQLLNAVDLCRKNNIKIVGYGASAKGNTLLNWLKLKLDYIVDDSNFKWDFLTPGMDVKICSPQVLYNEKDPVVILCLAWNFLDEIKQNVLKNTTVQHKFITYFPCVNVK
jgi:SAM-dependent methyltransferase